MKAISMVSERTTTFGKESVDNTTRRRATCDWLPAHAKRGAVEQQLSQAGTVQDSF